MFLAFFYYKAINKNSATYLKAKAAETYSMLIFINIKLRQFINNLL